MFQVNTGKFLKTIPGWVARFHISWTEFGVCSWGAWITITTDPTIQETHPRTPIFCSRSFNRKWAKTALHRFIPYISSSTELKLLFPFSFLYKLIHQLTQTPASKDLPDYYTQCAKRGYKNCWCIYISHKIGNLTNNHCKSRDQNQ